MGSELDETVHERGVQRESIAIIGAGCRLPGGASSTSKFWKFLIAEKSGHGQIPTTRFNPEGFYHPDPDRAGSIHSMNGYFIQEDINAFENAFFGINNLETSTMDAQQRKLLEVVYESLEDAGAHLEQVRGSNTGVYVGTFTHDHMIMQYKDPENLTRYSAVGCSPPLLANRITHTYDLRGPSVALDTACSSSLYALHAACLALDAQECDAAIVASANLLQSPEQQLIATKAGILSPDGRCHTFDRSANGYGRGEAVVSLYLKRLQDAVRDGDTIRSVIRGTATNGNGKTPGISQPSREGQEKVIHAAYRRAQLSTNDVGYVEAHGTGTKVGDPIEVEAIFRALHLPDDRRILVGGVKPSLGHSEGASGLSSVVKVMLSLEHATIPATIGVNEVNPNIKCAEWHTDLVTKCMPWPASVSMRASINAFGFGGANSHVIVEAPQPKKAKNLSPSGMLGKSARNDIKGGISNKTPHEAPAFILLSARTWKSLEQVVQDLARWCSETSLKDKICDLEYTLNTRRSRLETRTFLLIPQPHLPAHANLEDLPSNDIGKSTPLPLAFVFTGQGAQWTGMGKELYHQYDTFRSSIDQLDAHLQSLPPAHMPKWRIADVLTLVDTETSIHTADVCQPICSAVQIALVDLLRVWNIKPRYAVGHSSGEIAAAYAAGLLSAYDAILVAYFRGIAVAEHSGNGAMIATTLRPEEAKDFVRKQGFNESVSVACFNAPQSTTLSGDQQAIDKAFKLLQKKKCFVKRLSTDSKAYHSKHMNSVSEKYRDLLDTYWKKADGLQNRDLHQTDNTHDIVFNSTVTRNAISKDQIQSPGYWVQNLVSPVLFSEAMTTIMQECRCHFLELGPHSSLQLPLKEIQLALNSGDDELLYNSALRRETNGVITMLSLLGSLFVQGHDTVDFGRASPNLQHSHRKPTTLHDLPTYPWDYTDSIRPRQSRTVEEFRSRKYPRHELLGSSIPGGSRFTRAWRNILDVNETPWLKDHRLGPSIVFPAAAYIAMAAEAVSQAHDITTSQCHGIELRRVNFLKALNLDEERRSRVEVVTELRPHSITAVRSSDKWWEFTVTSIHDDAGTTTHVNALVAVNESPEPLYRHVKNDCKSLSRENTSKWYDKFHKEGLNWGPEFAVMQDIHTDRSRQECFARSKTRLRRGLKRLSHDQYEYIAHPVNIDGMLQTAFVATTAGWVRDLRATVPVSMESVRISCSALANFDSNAEWFYDAASTKVGCGTVSIDAELYNTSDEVLIHMEKVRCIPYQGNVQRQGRRARQRLARIEWKPDLSMLQTSDNDGHLEYIRWYTERIPSSMKDRSLNDRHALALLDLAVHKNPNGRVVYLGPESTFVDAMKITLRTDQQLRRCASFHTGCLDLNGTFNLASMIAQDEDLDGNRPDKLFDTVVCDRMELVPHLCYIVAPSALIIMKNDPSKIRLQPLPFRIVFESFTSGAQLLIAPSDRKKLVNSSDVYIVNRSGSVSELEALLLERLQKYSQNLPKVLSLEEAKKVSLSPRCTVIATVEVNEPLITRASPEEIGAIQRITQSATRIIWITSTDMIKGGKPDFAPILGIARTVMLEQPGVKFAVLDVNHEATDVRMTARNVTAILENLTRQSDSDTEFIQLDGVLHVSRWEPEVALTENSSLKLAQGTIKKTVASAGNVSLQIGQPGQFDTMHFASQEFEDTLAEDHVEVQVKSVGLNAKDLYVLAGKIDTKNVTCSCECSGVIVAVGSGITDLIPGDRVVCMAPAQFASYGRLPRWAIHKLQDDESFTTFATIPVVFSTALHALKNKANLQEGESVLIHSAAGGVGLAAVQVATRIGAEVFCTVGSDVKKTFLVENFGIDPSRVFNSRDTSFKSEILRATSGYGVDVILNSLTGELLHASVGTCADFGRFVEIGKRDILDHGSLDLASFGRNISFMAFDLADIYTSGRNSHKTLWQQLLSESLELVRSGVVRPCHPIETFPASRVSDAFKYFTLGTRIGKVAVSFEDESDEIELLPSRYETRFDPQKTYLMVGCLGGLGRSISRWMILCGARRFVFLGRSGLDKQAARDLVEDLQNMGAKVDVVRGDVGNYQDVEEMIEAAKKVIGGVVQAAMGLGESLWADMLGTNWADSIRPKVQGTWNLHHALRKNGRDRELEFFLMTSSICGTVGVATESNYCASNAFLDAFARYRTSLGLPAISIGFGSISEVGYLHEHQEIENLMKRRGVYSIDENEFLQIMDQALMSGNSKSSQARYDKLSTSHLLTGIEFIGLQEQRELGFEGDLFVLSDPRAAVYTAAFARDSQKSDAVIQWNNHQLPEEVRKALQNESTTTLLDAITNIVCRKMSNLILLPMEKLQVEKALGEYGLDSMLASEFRTFIFRIFEVDVPFLTVLDKTSSVRSISRLIADQLEERLDSKV